MINPVNHARTPEGVATYKVEPYVVAADVYAVAPHTGRGGWTWYTGSAGWMYRLIVESLLGLTLEGGPPALRAVPARGLDGVHDALPLPRDHVPHRRPADAGRRRRRNPAAAAVTVDGVVQADGSVHLVDDRAAHQVVVEVQAAGT